MQKKVIGSVLGIIMIVLVGLFLQKFFVRGAQSKQEADVVTQKHTTTETLTNDTAQQKTDNKPDENSKEVKEKAPAPEPENQLPLVDLAPDFTLSRLDGGEMTLSSYRDVKPVIIDFFTTWCHNCRRDMPKEQKLYDKYGDDVEVIAVNLGEKERVVKRYVKNGGFTFPVVLDKDASAQNAYKIRFTNTHVLITKSGTIQEVVFGDLLEKHFKSLLH